MAHWEVDSEPSAFLYRNVTVTLQRQALCYNISWGILTIHRGEIVVPGLDRRDKVWPAAAD
jgi:hypothetical protein